MKVHPLPTATLFLLSAILLWSMIFAQNANAQSTSREPITHQTFNGVAGPLTESGDAPMSLGGFKNPPSPICSTTFTSASNVDTDCAENVHNETSIAVNPTNPLNQIASANDYQLRLTSGLLQETVLSRVRVTFDGGSAWTEVPVPANPYTGTGDPAVAFDAQGTAYLATLGFGFGQGSLTETTPDIIVSHSTDGGQTWSALTRIAGGTGTITSVGIFNDKEYVAAWGNGNAIVTWTVFNLGKGSSYISSPIFASVTHDGGNTWTAPTEISGSASFCLGAHGGTACDQDQFSSPTVAADGSIYVAFESTYNLDPTSLAFGADQYLVVKVDPATGKRVAGPYLVAQLVDGVYAYPFDFLGRQTYQDSQFRTNSAGNLVSDPTNAQHLAVIWSDMRNSRLPANPAAYNPDPYSVTTNSDIIVSQSSDGGQTWSAPTALTSRGDQFFPWGAYDSSGKLRIGYFDRSYDSANHKFGYTLATEKTAGSLSFNTTQLTTALSDPTKNDRWFSGTTVNSNFPHPTSFLGDYSNIAIKPTGSVALWTDFRINVCFGTFCGAGEDAFYASVP
jgi:hypothetical protein